MNFKDFFNKLLDLNFSEPFVKNYAPILFIIAIAAAAIRELFQLLEAFATGKFRVIVNGLIMTPIGILFWIIVARLLLDGLLCLARLSSSMQRMEHAHDE